MADPNEQRIRRASRLKEELVGMGYEAWLRYVRQLELLAASFGRGIRLLIDAAIVRMLEAKPPDPIGAPAPSDVLRELMRVYSDPDRAVLLVKSIGFPEYLRPRFTSSQLFFDTVVKHLNDGVPPGSFDALTRAAAREHPHNPTFRGDMPTTCGPPDLFTTAREIVSNEHMWTSTPSPSLMSTDDLHIELVKRMRRYFVQIDDSTVVRIIDAFTEGVSYENARAQLGLDEAELERAMKCLRHEVGKHARQDRRR
jgi:hypothetical protein